MLTAKHEAVCTVSLVPAVISAHFLSCLHSHKSTHPPTCRLKRFPALALPMKLKHLMSLSLSFRGPLTQPLPSTLHTREMAYAPLTEHCHSNLKLYHYYSLYFSTGRCFHV